MVATGGAPEGERDRRAAGAPRQEGGPRRRRCGGGGREVTLRQLAGACPTSTNEGGGTRTESGGDARPTTWTGRGKRGGQRRGRPHVPLPAGAATARTNVKGQRGGQAGGVEVAAPRLAAATASTADGGPPPRRRARLPGTPKARARRSGLWSARIQRGSVGGGGGLVYPRERRPPCARHSAPREFLRERL